MGIISRYFQRLAAIVRAKRTTYPAVSADATGLRIGDELVAWNEVYRLDAYNRELYVGNFHCLTIYSAGNRLFEINEETPGWNEAGDAIEHYLAGSLPHAEWKLRLMASNPGETVTIYYDHDSQVD